MIYAESVIVVYYAIYGEIGTYVSRGLIVGYV